MPHDSKNNPYSQAAGVYGKQKQETPDQREMESDLLIKAAGELRKLHDHWDDATPEDINTILTYNRKLWTVFFDSAVENPDDRPKALRENIISLCNFIFKRTINILAEPEKEKLLVLIDINREIAAGLKQSVQDNPQDSETDSAQSPATSDVSEGERLASSDTASSDTDEADDEGGHGGFTPTSV